jgi:hypothetical protein
LAEEVGLTSDDAGTRGWDDTSGRESTGDAYEIEVRRIWTSRRTLAESALVCSKCHQPYSPVDRNAPGH